MQHIDSLQSQVISHSNHLQNCKINLQKLHITSLVFDLRSIDEINEVKDWFQSCQQDILQSYSSTIDLSFYQIKTFATRVLYLEIDNSQQNQLLFQIQDYFKNSIQRNERIKSFLIQEKIDKQWIPHVTILKTSADRKNKKKLDIRLEDYNHIHSHSIPITTPLIDIELLSMYEHDKDSGYYKSICSLYNPSTNINTTNDNNNNAMDMETTNGY